MTPIGDDKDIDLIANAIWEELGDDLKEMLPETIPRIVIYKAELENCDEGEVMAVIDRLKKHATSRNKKSIKFFKSIFKR